MSLRVPNNYYSLSFMKSLCYSLSFVRSPSAKFAKFAVAHESTTLSFTLNEMK